MRTVTVDDAILVEFRKGIKSKKFIGFINIL